ncbi:MAG: HAD hydrolase-like protein [Eubacteriales bacterium]
MRNIDRYTHVIWDFNGTLLDDVDCGIASVNEMLSRRKMKCIGSKEEYRERFGFPITEYYRRCGFDFDRESFEALAVEWVELYERNSYLSSAVAGTMELLSHIKAAGIVQLILSASEYGMLRRQCGELGISKYFSEFLGLSDIYAGSKLDIAVGWRGKNPDARPLFIGDTEHDAQCAEAIKSDCALLLCGHQGVQKLSGLGFPIFDGHYELDRYLFAEIE